MTPAQKRYAADRAVALEIEAAIAVLFKACDKARGRDLNVNLYIDPYNQRIAQLSVCRTFKNGTLQIIYPLPPEKK